MIQAKLDLDCPICLNEYSFHEREWDHVCEITVLVVIDRGEPATRHYPGALPTVDHWSVEEIPPCGHPVSDETAFERLVDDEVHDRWQDAELVGNLTF